VSIDKLDGNSTAMALGLIMPSCLSEERSPRRHFDEEANDAKAQ
jgi:hypothetical protein